MELVQKNIYIYIEREREREEHEDNQESCRTKSVKVSSGSNLIAKPVTDKWKEKHSNVQILKTLQR